MAQNQPGGNATVRTIVVLALTLLIAAGDTVNLVRIAHPIGLFGYGTNLDGVVTGVDRGSPAARAGLQVGDRLDEATMTPQELEDLIQIPAVQPAGRADTFAVFHHGARRTVSLVSEPEPMGVAEATIIVISLIAGLAFLGIGVAVVLLRPSVVSWSFYLYCLGNQSGGFSGLFFLSRPPVTQVLELFMISVISIGQIALLIFALRFLQEPVGGWRSWVQRAVPFVAIAYLSLNIMEIVNTYILGRPAETIARAVLGFQVGIAIVVAIALLDTYVRRKGADRQRIRWVVLGFAVAVGAAIVSSVLQTELTNTPLSIQDAIPLLNIFAPVAVAYAIVKHRVIDVNFVVSRTLVYGILTTLFVAMFALVDWFVGRVLDQTRWALIAEIGVAIAIGFWLNGLHARVDRFVDSVLFRRRHEAERSLARVARGLPHATSMALVDKMLVSEPFTALDLTSAALFRRNESGGYDFATSMEWPDGTIRSLQPDDSLIPHLQGEAGALRISSLQWAPHDVPTGSARPALAVPVLVRRQLEAIALYGPHSGGEDFDPDELQWLNALAVAAGAAYDHLEADALRRELAESRRESESLRIALQRFGPLPAGQ